MMNLIVLTVWWSKKSLDRPGWDFVEDTSWWVDEISGGMAL